MYFLGEDHSVLALRASDGTTKWSGRTYDGPGQVFGYGGCAIAGEFVVCNDSTLVALRRRDGSVVWRFQPTVGRFPGYASFVVNGETIYAGSASGVVYAIDAATGQARWVQAVLNGTGTTINVTDLSADGDAVFAPFTRFLKPQRGGVMALDARTGAVRWTTDYPRPAPDSLTGALGAAIWNDLVFASCDDGRIYALSRASGVVQWFLPGVGNGSGAIRGPFGADMRGIAISGSILYAGSGGGWLIAYDIFARREKWRAAIAGSDKSYPPLIADQTIYDVLLNGHLVAVSDRGSVQWDYGGSPNIVGQPVVGSGRIFVAARSGFWALSK